MLARAFSAKPEGPQVGPIIASIGKLESHQQKSKEWKKLLKQAVNVDYEAEADILDARQFKNAGKWTYVFSTIDASPKFSKDYFNCTGIAAVGVDRETGQNVSFLTHQNPQQFLSWKKGDFERDIRTLLGDFKKRIKPGTEDVLVFGGNNFADAILPDKSYADLYQDSISFVSSLVKEELGLDAHVAVGPNMVRGGIAGLLDTEKRRLYLARPMQVDSSVNIAYSSSELTDATARMKSATISDIDARRASLQ